MLDARGRDIGEANIIFCVDRRATPEEVAENRAMQEDVQARLLSDICGCPMEAEILYDLGPEEWFRGLPVCPMN